MGALFNPPKPPPVPAPTPMPDPQSPAVLEAQRNKMASLYSAAGRSSTNLTTPTPAASGSSYSGSTLGGGR